MATLEQELELTKEQKAARVKLIELLIDNLRLQRVGKSSFEDYCRDIANRVRSGEFTEENILNLQYPMDSPVVSKGDFITLIAHIQSNSTSGFTYAEAIELGHKIQFIYLSYHQAQGRTDGNNLFRESMKPHEDGIDAIYKGTYDKTKLAVLMSLPEVSNWDHAKGAAAYHKIFN